MTSNYTISHITSICTFGILQLQVHALAVELNFYLLTILGIFYPVAVISSALTLIAICTIRSWRSSTRTYYYVVAVANIIALLSADWQTFLLVLYLWATRWFPNEMKIVYMLHFELSWSPLCAIYNFVTNSILLPKLWVIMIFCVHRTWIVFQPLSAPLVKRIFRPALVIGFPVGLVVFATPFLWLSYIDEGNRLLL